MRRRFHPACLLLAPVCVALTLSACSNATDQTAATAPVVSVPGAPASSPSDESQSLAFFDADAFDSSLASTLKSGPKEVHVTFAGTTSVNNMPPRINAWLTEVKKSDGKVVAQDPSKPTDSRGLLGLGMIADVIDLVTWYRERSERQAQLATANDYNATIMFDSQSGSLKELVFERR